METPESPDAWTSLILFERYRGGDDTAADELFSRYFHRLTLLARSRLSARVAQRTDPEDVVLSAYRSFFVGARDGRFFLARGGDLWRLLASITRHKLLRQLRHHTAEKRSVHSETPLDSLETTHGFVGGPEPSLEDAVALSDQVEAILSQLSHVPKRVLELRLQGAPISEIAIEIRRSERTVRRTLADLREHLAGEFADA